ncbi:CpsD/CapB family tyrosine-protein kinase [Fodinisporobacter ferrooxydans]|uniref:CpsD/CapB family tyrosine-protein kinase n=1 Tax=Fodinisporobacter ferrooxydans TaxID=2901836 RepID=A0ABY4CM96_9BACL|nr:CpsD/CapB family tyrosine-protein kinase [Alicyclobacillaceae bacterium MYW30-H2]
MKKKPYDINRKLISFRNPDSPTVESFRSIRTNIRFASQGREVRTILVTSANENEGKSLICSNLAVVMAQNNTKTLYVDADMRKPNGHHAFRLSNDKGLSTYLSCEHSFEEILQYTVVPYVSAVTAGQIPKNPLELLETEYVNHFLKEAAKCFEVVIIDSPPLIVSDALLLASKADGCVLVVDAKNTKREDGEKAVEKLRSANANILGVVLNNTKEKQYYY